MIGQPILAADGQQKIDPQRHDGFLDCGPWLLVGGQSLIESALYCVDQPSSCLVAKFKIPKKKFQHLHGELNLDEIKNALHSLPVNRETNLMNLIRP